MRFNYFSKVPIHNTLAKYTIFIVLAVAISALSLSISQAQDQIVFTSGIDPATSHGLIAKNLGLFDKHGVNVTVKKFSSANAGVKTIYAGENHTGVAGDMNILSPLAQGNYSVRVIGQLRRGLKGYGAAVVAADIKKPSDLEGKKIGLLQGTPVSHLFFELYAKKHGIKDVERVWLRPQEQLIAFSKGDIDGLFIFSPWWQKALKVRDGAHVLVPDHEAGLSASIIVTIREDLIDKPETVKSILRAIKEADDYLNSNREGTVKVLAKETKIEPELINSILDSLEQRLTLDSVLVNNLCREFAFLKDIGRVPPDTKIDWNKVILTEYMEELYPDRVSIKKPITCG